MKNQEILNQQQQDQEITTITAAFSSIFNGNSKQIHYSDTYNSVYKLCKRGFAEQILNQLNNISRSHFQQILKNMDKQQSKIIQYIQMMNKANQSIQRIGQVLLYLQSNYLNDPKRQYNKIKDILNSAFFNILCQNKIILTRICQQIAQARINGTQGQVTFLIQLINNLDQKQVFFPQFLYQIYLNKISQHYKKLFLSNYENLSTKQFFQKASKSFQQEREYIQRNFMRVKGKKLTAQLMKKIYEGSFDQLRQIIYSQKSQELFKSCTLQFLELLNQKNEEKQINNFNDWYVNQIGKRLTTLDRKNNDEFLKNFIKLYLQISQYLQKIKKFNIGYKTTFYFQNWINEDKIQLARRLNTYFQSLILKNANSQQCLRDFSILFKFLKQKDLFQKQFRRMSAVRMIYDTNKYHLELQNNIIDYMAAQCGQDWVIKLKSLKQSIQENNLITYTNNSEFNALVFEDAVWPFQGLKYRPTIPQQLLHLSQKYRQAYQQKFKGRAIQWHPIQGFVILSIKFNNLTQQFKMDTAMATIMLNLQSLKFKSTVKQILQFSGLKIEDVIDQIGILQRQKLIILSTSLKDIDTQKIVVEMNLNFKPSSQVGQIDFTHRYLQIQFIQKQQHEELKAQRKMMVEAFIVKIMKSNKSITMSELYQQITPMIQGRGFKFNDKFVQNAFKGLIDKRYIKDIQDGTFTYLAS